MSIPNRSNCEALFEAHIPCVFGRAFRLLRDRHAANDVVQDVYLKWRKQCAIDVPKNPRSWLVTVASRRVFEIGRRPTVSSLTDEHYLRLSQIDDRSTLEDEDKRLLHADIIEALAKLTDMQRGVLLAKVMDEMTFRAIAEGQGVAEPTVKTHYLRALKTMRDALSPRWSKINEK